MNTLYSVDQIRAIERATAAVLPPGALMQRAGQSAANAALDLLPFSTNSAKVLVLAGPGDNGGDALEAAAHLSYTGAQVTVIHIASPASAASSAERVAALARAQSSDARFREAADAQIASTEWNLIIDGLFGIGLKRPISGGLRALVDAINQLHAQVLALDVPSGLDADTGCVVGPDGVAIRATHTVTFIGDKPGLHTCDGRDYAGLVDVASLQIDASHYPPSQLHLNDVKLFARHLHPRRRNGPTRRVHHRAGERDLARRQRDAKIVQVLCGAQLQRLPAVRDAHLVP